MIKDYINISYTFLKNRGLRSFLTMVGILIGIAAVISLIGLGEGMRETITSQFNFLSTDVLTVRAEGLTQGPPGEGVVNPLQEHYIDDIERLNGVDEVISRVIETTQIKFNKRSDFTFAGSLPEEKEKKELILSMTGMQLEKGRMVRKKETDAVIIGHNYHQPDRFGKAVDLRDHVTVQGKKYEVVGILKKQGSFIVDNLVLMDINAVKDLFDTGEDVDVILVKARTIEDIPNIKARVEKYLRDERDVDEGEEDFIVETPEQALEDLNATLFAVQIFIYVIAGISIIVGGIGITNTMYTSVVERTKHIGVMKSIGATRTNIFTLFLIESGLLGLVGGLAGIALGLGLAYGLSYLAQVIFGLGILSVSISWTLILATLIFSYIVGTIAGMLPALQASKLIPVDALRHSN